ncbi:MAG: hypothetical protein JSW52_02525 [Candidatus Coatesbacteria bacterium]|nr:MAG: hypothetical protein JSW52_02525 [Candidatus Coatesbacteria bacterium]
MKYISILLITIALAFTGAAAVDIQDAYDACGPANGYDKYLVLNPATTYTGELTVDTGKDSCIKGNGAVIHLDNNGRITASGSGTELDIDHTVIYGNGSGQGVRVDTGAKAAIDFCTIDNLNFGVLVWDNSTTYVKNSITTNHNGYGVGYEDTANVNISYTDSWNNGQGNYGKYCEG